MELQWSVRMLSLESLLSRACMLYYYFICDVVKREEMRGPDCGIRMTYYGEVLDIDYGGCLKQRPRYTELSWVRFSIRWADVSHERIQWILNSRELGDPRSEDDVVWPDVLIEMLLRLTLAWRGWRAVFERWEMRRHSKVWYFVYEKPDKVVVIKSVIYIFE